MIIPFGFNFKKSTGAGAWYYSDGWSESYVASLVTNTGDSPELYIYGGPVAISTGGTLTALAVSAGSLNESSITVKIAIYSSAGALVASGVTESFSDAQQGWRQVTVNQAINSGTYYIMVSASSAQCGLLYRNDVTNGIYQLSAPYSSMPLSTITIPPSTVVNLPGVRAYVN